MRRSSLVALCVLLLGSFGPSCVSRTFGGLDGGADTDATTSDTTGSTTADTTSGPTTGEPECPQHDLGSGVPAMVSGSTIGEPDDFASACGGVGASDVAVSFVAPADGTYVFDTAGSGFDTVLYALDGVCGGLELACNDDALDLSSRISVTLKGGQSITLVVDGLDGMSGDGEFVLRVTRQSPGVCPQDELGSDVPVDVAGSTVGAGSGLGSSCGGADAPEHTYLWTAPFDGLFTFDTFGSAFDTVLHVLDGACEGVELVCSDDSVLDATSGVVAELAGGQMVTLVVDGFGFDAGPYNLHVDWLDGFCPVLDAGSTVPLEDFNTTLSGGNSGGTSCGGWFADDVTYTWAAPMAGTYRFAVEAGYPWVLAVRSTCGGSELACTSALEGGPGQDLSVELDLGELVVIQVDGLGRETGDYVLRIEPSTCPDEDLGTAVPQSVQGNLFQEDPTLEAGCAPTWGRDRTFRWTAPASGTYFFDTVGSNFDTVLHARSDSCNGPSIACDDDSGGDLKSAFALSLQQGESIVLVVDGFEGDAGSFRLNIDGG